MDAQKLKPNFSLPKMSVGWGEGGGLLFQPFQRWGREEIGGVDAQKLKPNFSLPKMSVGWGEGGGLLFQPFQRWGREEIGGGGGLWPVNDDGDRSPEFFPSSSSLKSAI